MYLKIKFEYSKKIKSLIYLMINNDLGKLKKLYNHNQDLSMLFNSLNYLLVIVKKSVDDLSQFASISAIEVDSKEIYINYENNKYLKTLIFSDFTLGIILGDNKFLKKDYSLKMFPNYINNNYSITSVNISLRPEFNHFIEFHKNFRFISIQNQHLYPICLPCNISKIDIEKKYIDLSISRYYHIL